MKLLTFCLLSLMPALALAEPPVLEERPLSTIKASVKVPPEWKLTESSEDGVVVYQITREAKDGFAAGITISVTPDVPGRAQVSPSQYASDLLSFSVEEGGTVETVAQPPFKVISTQYNIDGEDIALSIKDVARANDSTGTLYFVAWQSPKSEENEIKELREQVLASFKFDPKF